MRLGQKWYNRSIAGQVKTEGNIGKVIVIDVETGDYEIDAVGMNASERLRAKRPDTALFAVRIGYSAVESFSGGLGRSTR